METLSGDTGTGALIALDAIGKQDEKLCNLEEFVEDETPFLPKHRQHTEFIRYFKSFKKNKEPNNPTWPFGSRITFKFQPKTMGDLLANMYLKLTLPELSDGVWTDRIGRAIVEEIEFRVDDVVVEKLTDYMLVGYDELFVTDRIKNTKLYTENGELHTNSMVPVDLENRPFVLPIAYGTGNQQLNNRGFDLFINLNLFFSRAKNWFPVCSIYNQELFVTIVFRNQSWFTNTTGTVFVNQISLVTEEVTLSHRERLFYMKNPRTLEYKTIEKQTIQTVDNTEGVKSGVVLSGTPRQISLKLNSTMTLSGMYWFMQNSRFGNTSSYSDSVNSVLFLNRYNFSSHENFSNINPLKVGYSEPYYSFEESDFPLLSKISITTSQRDIQFLQSPITAFSPESSIFFRNIQSQIKGLNTPTRNIYSYFFEQHPLEDYVSGGVNTSINKKTDTYTLTVDFLDTTKILSNTYQLHVYNVGYMSLSFEDGFLKKNS